MLRYLIDHKASGKTEILGIILLLSLMISCQPEKEEMPPNFLFILVDDLGWTDLGCYGSTFYETPNIDRFSEKAVKFTDAYAACPVCSPTRASIMTGKYPARMNTTDWFGAPQPYNVEKHWTKNKPLIPAEYIEYMPLEEITIAEVLKENGYSTFFAGKWHLGKEGYYPEDQGFDINKGGWERGGPYGPGKYFTPYGNPKLEDGPEGEHLPDRLAQETIDFISLNKDNPFFAYLSFYSVHTPLIGRPDLVEKYEAKSESVNFDAEDFIPLNNNQWRQVQNHAVYAAMVEAMDEAVGRVLKALDSLNLSDNTVVFFMSDNGGLSTSEGHPTTNLPLKAGKGWLYEGGIREPMIIRWPGVSDPNSVCNYPVTSTDFYPTILDMANIPLKPDQHIDGISMVPLLNGEDKLSREAIYWHYPHYGNQGGSPGSAIRSGNYKLIEYFEDGHLELYDLSEDIGELENLIETRPEIADSLLVQLENWRLEVEARYPSDNPAFQPE
ncbi:MAG: sulfatase [Cyclobacteriaceae bacterium]